MAKRFIHWPGAVGGADTAAVSHAWRITEHTANVAAQFADRWATAATARTRRIQQPENTLERVPDTWVQVSVLRQLLRAAQMAKQATEAETAQRRIQDAIEAFLDAIVVETAMADGARAFKLARDALEHFDNYYQGIGDEQQPGTRRRDRSPREDLAQQYRAELDGQPGSARRLRIGPLRPADPLVVIDLVEHAPRASSRERLALATGAGRRYSGCHAPRTRSVGGTGSEPPLWRLIQSVGGAVNAAPNGRFCTPPNWPGTASISRERRREFPHLTRRARLASPLGCPQRKAADLIRVLRRRSTRGFRLGGSAVPVTKDMLHREAGAGQRPRQFRAEYGTAARSGTPAPRQKPRRGTEPRKRTRSPWTPVTWYHTPACPVRSVTSLPADACGVHAVHCWACGLRYRTPRGHVLGVPVLCLSRA